MQIGEVPVSPVGCTEAALTVTACVTPAVFVEHGAASTIRTQYVVFEVGLTEMEAPVPAIALMPTTEPVPHW